MTAPLLHAHRPDKPRQAPAKPSLTVHVLAQGKALCGKPGVELDGASGHTWVQAGDPIGAKLVSCSKCLGVLMAGRR